MCSAILYDAVRGAGAMCCIPPTVPFKCDFSIHFPLHCHFNYFNVVANKKKNNRDIQEHVFIVRHWKRYGVALNENLATFISGGYASCNFWLIYIFGAQLILNVVYKYPLKP